MVVRANKSDFSLYSDFEYKVLMVRFDAYLESWNVMRDGCRCSTPLPLTYLLPATAYLALIQTRDHLRLFAQLTEPQSEAGPDVVYLSAQALAHCFDRLADHMDRVAEAVDPVAS